MDLTHDQSIVLGELRFTTEYPFADGWAVAAHVPLRIVHTDITYRTIPDGQVVDNQADPHHRDETLVGIADPWLLLRHAPRVGRFTLDGQVGVALPLGRTEENPFTSTAPEHQHVQFGTGTFSPVVGAGARFSFSSWSPGIWALAIFVPYENDKGYQAGNRYAGGINAMSGLGLDRWAFRAGVQAQAESAERWSGVKPTDDGNQGRADLFADLGGSAGVGDGWSLTAGVKIPLWTHVVGGQLDFPAIFEIGLLRTLELGQAHEAHAHAEGEGRDEHEGHGHEGHEHADAPPADWTGLDVVAVAPDGEAVDLVPAPGKITVFDFWASWCVPCRELDARLADLSRRHPGRIAVRRIRVETWDKPAARRYLGDAPSLPHVKVLGADGKERFAKSGDPADLAAAIEALLR